MKNNESNPIPVFIFIPLCILVFIRPFFSGLAYPVFELYYENILIFLALLVFIAGAKTKFRTFPYNFNNFPVLFLLCAYSVSTIFSIDVRNSISEMIKFASFAALFFVVSQSGVNQKKIIVKTIIAAAFIISLYSVYQYFWGYPHTIAYLKKINSDFLLKSSYARDILLAKRAIGTFPSPNMLGGYLVIAFFLSLELYRGRTSTWRFGLGSGLASVGILIALLLTKSLGAWLSLLGALIILFTINFDSLKKRKIILFSSIALILIALTFILATRWERLIDIQNPQNSITQRLNYWRTAIAVIKDNFVFGVGPGNFKEVFLKYKTGLSTDTRYAHNVFLHIFSETGIPGLMAILYLFIALFKRSNIKKHGFIFIAIFAFVFHNLIDNTFFIPETAALFWISMGLIRGSNSSPLLKHPPVKNNDLPQAP